MEPIQNRADGLLLNHLFSRVMHHYENNLSLLSQLRANLPNRLSKYETTGGTPVCDLYFPYFEPSRFCREPAGHDAA